MFPGVHFLDALICKCKNKKNLHTKLSQNLELSPNHLWEKLYKKAIKNLCYLVVQVVHIFTKQISAFLVAWKIFVYNFVVITTQHVHFETQGSAGSTRDTFTTVSSFTKYFPTCNSASYFFVAQPSSSGHHLRCRQNHQGNKSRNKQKTRQN